MDLQRRKNMIEYCKETYKKVYCLIRLNISAKKAKQSNPKLFKKQIVYLTFERN